MRSVLIVQKDGRKTQSYEALQCPTCNIIYVGYTVKELTKIHACPGSKSTRRPSSVLDANGNGWTGHID